MTDYPNNIPAKLEIIKASEITPKEVRWLWYPYIPFGKVKLLQGDPSDGKSKLMLSLAALLSKGAPLPFADEDESGEPMTVIYQTTEDDADDTVVPRFNSAGGDGDRLIFIKEDEKSLTIHADLCYLYGTYLEDYLHDVEICQQFAQRSRERMAEIILEKTGMTALYSFNTIHNYIDTKEMILRKGSIAAHDGELVLILINMRDGSVLARGKGNPEWNYSAPHGAGRLMSRTKARETLDLEAYRKTMEGIYTTSVNEATIDEAPMAYKSLEDIIDIIRESVDVITENGAVTNASTMSDCLDLFAAIGALRAADDQEIIRRFVRAYAEDADIAMKILFFGRDVRGGLGERWVFRVIINWLAENRTESLRKNIELIPEFGRYDDLVSLISTACEKDALRTIRKQLEADLASDAEVSLLAKWLPSVNASNAETVRKAKRIARYLGMSDAEYRKTLVDLRRKIRIMEHSDLELREH